ncbi:MAG: TatD family deoxyribonuclease [Myxococcales bacterium FL481]|nr:MAG: TatD family deoxyribonuclease [Myxococcales bacterium FL481]
MGLFDVHAHLTHPRFDADRDDVLTRATAAGVTSIICNGLNPRDNAAVMELASRWPLVKPAVGLYPVDAVLTEMLALGVEYPHRGPVASASEGVASVRRWIDQAFAVGEIGLDGYWVPESLWERQEQVFVELVQLAMAHDKPVIIHTRKREARAFDLLRDLGATRVDWHCFGGKVKLARKIADHGHYLSIPANVARSQSFRRMIETLPRERLLLETDCPYLSPAPGTRNEPANVAGTGEFAARSWGLSLQAAHEQFSRNFSALFGCAP